MLSFLDPMHQSASSTATSPPGSFLRGISYFEDTILVGDSVGGVHAIGDATGQKRFRVLVRMETIDCAISCIATDSQYVIAATECGDVAYFLCSAFQTGSSERVKGVVSGFGFSATACCAKNGFAVVAYSTGSMRVFSLEQMNSGSIDLIADIGAHSRCINGIALNSFSSRYSVATCSEDHIVRVWDLQNLLDSVRSPRGGRAEVRITFEEKCESAIFTGVCFISSESVAAASYDDDFISVFSI
jgi:WD40 repeat protein